MNRSAQVKDLCKAVQEREDADESNDPDVSSIEGEVSSRRSGEPDAAIDIDFGREVEFVRAAVGFLFDDLQLCTTRQ